MCFTEYIRYGCGHRSIPILRPCPLTTHIPTNPVCPKSAERPTLATNMCPGCARIIHTRWVEIVTIEHQFMHERGVCGCPVKFPALQEPRMMTRPANRPAKNEVHHSADKDKKNDDSNTEITIDSEDDSLDNVHDQDQDDSTALAPAGSEAPSFPVIQQNGPAEFGSAPRYNKPYTWQPQTQTVQYHHAKGYGENMRPRVSNLLRRGMRQKFGSKKKAKQNKKAKKTSTVRPQPHALAWNTASISPFHEVEDEMGGGTAVAVRLPSLYGAEWIQDHAQIHEAGRCSCAVRFDTYQPYVFTKNDIALYGGEIDRPVGSYDYNSRSASEAQAWLDTREAKTAPNAIPSNSLGYHQTGDHMEGVDMGTSAFYPPYPSVACGPTTAAADAAVGTDLGYTIVMSEQSADMENSIPLVGWPLGAGPEGDSHSPQ